MSRHINNSIRRPRRRGFARRFRLGLLALTAGLVLIGSALTRADEPRIDEAWMRKYQQTAAGFEVRSAGREAPLTLHAEPVLTYTNSVRIYQQHGALYLWTDRGRPLFVGCVWSGADLDSEGQYRYLSHEGHSLSSAAVRVTQADQVLWESPQQGVRWEPVTGATPAGSRPLRLAQMRQLARRVEVQMAAETSDLRLLSQPVYRYPEDAADVVDGAIFTWVMGTDPEVFLVIEAVEQEWRMAACRFTNEVVTVTWQDSVIYECDRIGERTLRGPYWLNWDVARLPSDLTPSAP